MKHIKILLLILTAITFNSYGQNVKLYILYGDTTGYDSTVQLNGCSSKKYPVTIIASQNGNDIMKDKFTTFDIEKSSGLAVYSSSDHSNQKIIRKAQLDSGKIVIWIGSTSLNVANGRIALYPIDDTTIQTVTRGNISLSPCVLKIVKAFYNSNNGLGKVDMLEIYHNYELEQDELYDSIYLFWPDSSAENRRMVSKSENMITLDNNDLTHVTVNIREPFKNGLTCSADSIYGVAYWKNPIIPEIPPIISKFDISDGVGPIITYSGISNNGEFLLVCFSEPIKSETVYGHSLKLLKNGNEIDLNTDNIIATGDTLVFHLKFSGTEKPAIGDMVYINSQGPIMDLIGNHAHPDNKPVQIFQTHDTPILQKSIKKNIKLNTNNDVFNVIGQKMDDRILNLKHANTANNLLLRVEINGCKKALNIK